MLTQRRKFSHLIRIECESDMLWIFVDLKWWQLHTNLVGSQRFSWIRNSYERMPIWCFLCESQFFSQIKNVGNFKWASYSLPIKCFQVKIYKLKIYQKLQYKNQSYIFFFFTLLIHRILVSGLGANRPIFSTSRYLLRFINSVQLNEFISIKPQFMAFN